jgi:glycerate 2-kinase
VAAFERALGAVDPAKVVPRHLPDPPAGRTVVIGAGKASAAMARAVESHWPGELTGLVVTRYGHAVPCQRIEVREAAHPVPDAVGTAAAADMLALVGGLSKDDLVIGLFSGGGSALLPLPAGAVTLDDKRSLTSQLLRAGATIGEINAVRKHLSAIKGGRLACACSPARVVGLLISDVVGDDPSVIASGPLVPDSSTLADACHVIERYRLEASPTVLRHLSSPDSETPKPGDPCFDRVAVHVVASARMLLEAAARFFESRDLRSVVLSDSVEGESADAASVHAALAREVARAGKPCPAPCVLLSGGETTVTIRGNGRGGRNSEFLLALALALGEDIDYAALACDSDGIDGVTEVAGAIADATTLGRAMTAGLDPRSMLSDNDSHSFFAALGDTVLTGPTLTNVNDFRVILVRGPRAAR